MAGPHWRPSWPPAGPARQQRGHPGRPRNAIPGPPPPPRRPGPWRLDDPLVATGSMLRPWRPPWPPAGPARQQGDPPWPAQGTRGFSKQETTDPRFDPVPVIQSSVLFGFQPPLSPQQPASGGHQVIKTPSPRLKTSTRVRCARQKPNSKNLFPFLERRTLLSGCWHQVTCSSFRNTPPASSSWIRTIVPAIWQSRRAWLSIQKGSQ